MQPMTNYQAYLTRKAVLYKMHYLLEMSKRVYLTPEERQVWRDGADELAEIIELFDCEGSGEHWCNTHKRHTAYPDTCNIGYALSETCSVVKRDN